MPNARQNILRSIAKTDLAETAYDQLIAAIVRGDLPPGQRLLERSLADQLGVSRTPVREALLRLETEEMVSKCQSRGFVVSTIDVGEIEQLYSLIGVIESHAVNSMIRLPAGLTSALKNADTAYQAAQDVETRVYLGNHWHHVLSEGTGNTRAHDTLCALRSHVARYEHYFHRMLSADGCAPVPPQNNGLGENEHTQIVTALENSDFRTASDLIMGHWKNSARRLANLIEKRRTT